MNRIQINQNGNYYEIKFKYDPTLVAMVKQIPGKEWNPSEKLWRIHKDKLGMFLNILKGSKYADAYELQSNEQIGENAEIEPTTTIPNVDLTGIKLFVEDGSKLYPHQLDFMKYAIDRQRKGYRSGFLCADSPGLGKTIESVNYAMYSKLYNRYKHCLVICNVNTSKYNWQDDIRKHTNGKMNGYILGSRKRKHPKPGQAGYIVGSSQNKLDDLLCGHMYGDDTEPELPYFIILNVEAIRMKVGKRYPIADKIIDMINDGELNMIIIDEVHKNMSPTSLQGKQILRIKDKTHSRCTWVSLTGTPIVNKPTDVFLPMRLIDAHNFTSYYKWCQYFCVYGGYGGHEVIAYRNIPRLKFMLQQNMIRRRKEDVLDLPDKIHMEVYVENTKYQSRLAEEVTMDLIAHAEEIANDLNPMVRFLRLRQVNGSPELVDHDLRVDNTYLKYNAKLVKLLELLEEIHERGEKTVIFSNWVEPLRTLFKFLSSKYKVCCFTGTMSEAERQKHKRVFMNNPEYTVMIGTIGALGTTHTLTAANNIIFYDEPWTYADKLQAEDRCHRISAKKSVNVYTLISKDTIDERVHDIVYSKKDTSDYLVDNKLDFKNNPNLVATLLGKDI